LTRIESDELTLIAGEVTLAAAFNAKIKSDAANWAKLFARFDWQEAQLAEILRLLNQPAPKPETGNLNLPSATIKE
jgi:hypothetical protein